jgi:hypothetical protein
MQILFEWLLQNLAWLAAAISLLIVPAALFKFLHTRTEGEIVRGISRVERMHDQLVRLNERVAILSRALEEAPEKLDAAWVKGVNIKIGKIERDLYGLKELLFKDPDRAIEIPLILKDIEGIKTSIAAQERKFEWISGYNKWLLGVMATMALALLALAISVILKQ